MSKNTNYSQLLTSSGVLQLISDPTEVHMDSSSDYTLPAYFISPICASAAPTILLSIMTISLNIFVIKFYWKSEVTVVPLLYTLIAFLDILTALGSIHMYLIYLVYMVNLLSFGALNVNGMIFYFFTQISYRCSVFCNLVLAVSRTIMILKPFYQIKIKVVTVACALYAVPWIVLYGLDMEAYQSNFVSSMLHDGYFLSSGLTRKINKILPSFRIDVLITVSILPDIVAFIIPVIIVIITCIIQVISVHRSSQFPTSSNQRHVTITVLLMSALFVLCNSPNAAFLAYVIVIATKMKFVYKLPPNSHYVIIFLFTTLLPVLNAAFNPVIMIRRSSALRRKFSDSVHRMIEGVYVRRG